MSTENTIRAARRDMNFGHRKGWVVAAVVDHPSKKRAFRVARDAPLSVNIVLEGEGSFTDGAGRVWPLKKGACYFSSPEGGGRIVYSSKGACREFYLSIDRYTSRSLRDLGLVEPVSFAQMDGDSSVVAVCGSVLRRIALDESVLPTRDLIIEVAEFIAGIQKKGAKQSPAGSVAERIAAACLMLEDLNYRSTPIARIARLAGMAYHDFRRHFREYKRCPPAHYRVVRRIERSKILLKTMSVKETAAALGYGDQFMFSSQFRKVTGHAPSAK